MNIFSDVKRQNLSSIKSLSLSLSMFEIVCLLGMSSIVTESDPHAHISVQLKREF